MKSTVAIIFWIILLAILIIVSIGMMKGWFGEVNMPWWAYLIIVLAGIFAIYKIYQNTQDIIASRDYNAAVGKSQSALDALVAKGENPSYEQAEYISMGNSLATTFSGCGLDWSGVVVPTFQQMKNKADVYALIINYGVKTFDECGWGSFTGDLASALTYKTGGLILTLAGPSDIFTNASVSSINKILEQNGVDYKF